MAQKSCGGRFTRVSAAGWLALFAIGIVALWSPARAAADEPAARMLPGSVVDQGGHGIAQARVTLVRQNFRKPEVDEIATTAADAAGSFQFVLPAAMPESILMVWAEAPGCALTTGIVWDPAGGSIKLVLGEPASLEVRTVDEAGRPVAGVHLQPQSFFQEPFRFLNLPRSIAQRSAQVTDADGVAHFAGLPRESSMAVTIADARFARPTPREQSMRVGGPLRTIALIPGATMRGQVKYAGSGQPAPGVLVSARGTSGSGAVGLATTDAEGRYEITQLRPGTYNVLLLLPDELAKSWTSRKREKVVVASGATVTEIDLELISGAVLTGRITAEDNGDPVAEVAVDVTSSANHEFGSMLHIGRSDRDGRYTFRVPPGERMFLSLAQPPSGFLQSGTPRRDATLRDGETRQFDFQIPRRPAAEMVSVHVIAPDGQPVPGGDVILQTNAFGSSWEPISPEVSADRQVRLSFGVGDFNRDVRVRVRHGENATAEPLATTAGGDLTVKLVANAFGRLRGKVVDVGGNPIAGAKLKLTEWIGESGHGVEAAFSGKDGSFEIRHAWPGATVSVQAEAVRWRQESTKRHEIKLGETVDLPPLVLEPATLTLAGGVVDAAGEPLAGLSVSFIAERSADQETVTDRLGRFRFEGLAEETVSLYVGSFGGPTGSAKAEAGDSMVEIVATPPPPDPPPAEPAEGK